MEDEEANMNYILLDKKTKYDLKIIKKNAEKILNKLKIIDPIKDRDKYACLSCIFGAFLGDSMGSCCEFAPPSKNNHKSIFLHKNYFAPGEVTDDSEMAISAAFAYIDAINEDPSKVQDLIYYYFCIWCRSGPKDIGNATSSALRFWKNESIEETHFDYKNVQNLNWTSLANGFLMRISTFIVYYYYTHLDNIYKIIQNYFSKDNQDLEAGIQKLYFDIYIESSKNTEITHPNYENGISSAVFTLMTLIGMVTNEAKYVYSIFKIISNSKVFFECHQDKYEKYIANCLQKKYQEIINEVEKESISNVYNLMGYYIHGFKLSVYYVKKLADMDDKIKDNYYDTIMCQVCDLGGDTDTNCAIVGAMVGPLIGYKNFNEKYFEEFIKFIPQERCQYNSAFMYIYVDYLETKLLKEKIKPGEKDIKNKDEKKKEEQKKEGSKKEEGFLGKIKGALGFSSSNNENYVFKKTAFLKIKEFLNKELNI